MIWYHSTSKKGSNARWYCMVSKYITIVDSGSTPLHLLFSARFSIVNLSAILTTLVGPREVQDGNDEERVGWVRDTGKSVVPECNVRDDLMTRLAQPLTKPRMQR